MRESGEPAPAPIIMVKQLKEEDTANTAAAGAAPAAQAPAGGWQAVAYAPMHYSLKYLCLIIITKQGAAEQGTDHGISHHM